MKKETIFLRITIYVMALIMGAFCIIVIPHYLIGANNLMPDIPAFTVLLGVGLYLSAILFFAVLWQALRLLSFIDHEKAFSDLSVQALKRIKILAYSICVTYILELPIFFTFADRDDAPGVILVCAVFAGAPLVIAIFASVLEKLLQHAIKIKSENDLTI
ncbi:DUF2975 domain-containing protein [Companilactobacillus hulinensis]|uniref:DUF2975 domain-containing protein n=1 Tax=Companilactobacillus hulinensis TaxID=2486007 RepID=UPI000F774F28|nr:DUF2975 domain-containing protein [Companilactobacillus hulinensis]